MNLSKKIFFILFPFCSLSLWAQCQAELQIRTDLPSAKIYVDNMLSGKGNVEIKLDNGIHNIVVMEESDRWDAKSYIDTLIIHDCKDTVLNYSFKSQVYLDTEPPDVYVYEDSILIGHTPMFLPLNTENLMLKKEGFEQKIINSDQINTDEKIKLNFIGSVKDGNFFEQNLFKILVGGIVALGGVSAYYKIKADDNFDNYESTGDKYYLDQTHKYDLISGITFGALQVGFGFLIYYFLSD
jgi:hypothetical protein